jgi:hypothetical protein
MDCPGRYSTAGNLAFWFSPSDIDVGLVYELALDHLMTVPNGCSAFSLEDWRTP